jgi:hypothetical protein
MAHESMVEPFPPPSIKVQAESFDVELLAQANTEFPLIAQCQVIDLLSKQRQK